jgi:dTDP-4-amino-4,6-dideoxygalactose transaminase
MSSKIKIPPYKYYFPQESIKWIVSRIQELLESGDFLTQGKYVNEFEKEFCKYVNSKYAIAVSSGTAALEAILRAIDVQDYNVIVPTNTFAATAYAVIHAGGKPIFADIAKDMNINPADIKNRLTSRVKAIIPVHIGGLVSPNIYELLELSNQRGIYIIEDAAHAHGSELNGKKAGTFGIAAGFSFFSTKVITTGEGGMITTNNKEIFEKIQLLRDQGKVQGNWVGALGYNWRMTEFQAIIGLSQLHLIEEIIKKRTKIAKVYDELLKEIRVFEPLEIPENARPNYYKYLVFLPKGCNPEDLSELLKNKYGVRLSGYVYEAPLHRQSVFKHYVADINSYPIADDLCTRHIALPIYPQMTENEAEHVVDCLKSGLRDMGWM